MKLFRHGMPGKEKPGFIANDTMYDASLFGEDYDEIFFSNNGLRRLGHFAETKGDLCAEIGAAVRLASAVARPSKIVCIGLNYLKHAEETGAKVPSEPVIFFKSTSALCGPNDNIIIPRESSKTDWEVELALVIGKKAAYIKEREASDFIAGYVLHNDYSERAFQIERHGQWVKGKSCDTFAPLGPYLVTADEVNDPQNLNMWLRVNGEKMQESNTSDMIFKIPFLVHYVSQFMTLLPGDIISTGTPFGVGLGLKPPRYLKAGDMVELGIDGLGTQKQRMVSFEQAVQLGYYHIS